VRGVRLRLHHQKKDVTAFLYGPVAARALYLGLAVATQKRAALLLTFAVFHSAPA